jgi:hypothetical protein
MAKISKESKSKGGRLAGRLRINLSMYQVNTTLTVIIQIVLRRQLGKSWYHFKDRTGKEPLCGTYSIKIPVHLE